MSNESNASIYHVENGKCYILVEPVAVGREKQNLLLAIKMAKNKAEETSAVMQSLDDGSEEYDQLQDELNDHQMLIADFEGRIVDLDNRPLKQ